MEWKWETVVLDILTKTMVGRCAFLSCFVAVALSATARCQETQHGMTSGDLIVRMADVVVLSDESPALGDSLVMRRGAAKKAKLIQRGDRQEWVIGSCKGRGFVAYVGVENLVGTLRVYLNGDPRPAIEIESTIIFQGQSTLFSGIFSGHSAVGHGMWFPVTFGASAQVTIDADPGESEVVFRLNKTQPMQTFQMKDAVIGSFRAGESLGRLNATATDMSLKSTSQGAFTVLKGSTTLLNLAAGEQREVLSVSEKEGGVLTHLGVEDLGGFLNGETAPKLLVSIVADDRKTATNVPLLDLLGAPLGTKSVRQFMAGASTELGRHYRLSVPMPFAKTLTVTFRNASGVPLHGMALLTQTSKRKWTTRSRHLFVLTQPSSLKGKGELRGWMSRSRSRCTVDVDGESLVLAGKAASDGTSSFAASRIPKKGAAYRSRWMLLDALTFDRGIKLGKGSSVGVAWVYLAQGVDTKTKK